MAQQQRKDEASEDGTAQASTPVVEKTSLPRRRKRVLKWTVRGLLMIATVVAGTWAYVRYVQVNFNVVVPGQVYRSAQPYCGHLEQWAAEYGLRSVVNLRGGEQLPHVVAEAETVERLGLDYIAYFVPGKELPAPDTIRRLIEIIETAERPMLIHCRAGADRSGVLSAMAAMAVGGESFEEARKQLSVRYLHVDRHPVHFPALLGLYARYCREHDSPTGGWEQFRAWALGPYIEMAEREMQDMP